MNEPKTVAVTRARIASEVRSLRKGRRWTQAEFAARLGLSQSRLSEIERCDGSFTAEQFLLILKAFNVPVTQFVADRKPGAEVQNALARFGAHQLREDPDALPSARAEEVADLIREVLVAPESSRHVTALAPVIVANIDRLSLRKLRLRLADVGAERRLGWLVENTADALRHELAHDLPRAIAASYRRADVVLNAALGAWREDLDVRDAPDVLDTDVRSTKTLKAIEAARSTISAHWGIVSALRPEDFAESLRASRASV